MGNNMFKLPSLIQDATKEEWLYDVITALL